MSYNFPFEHEKDLEIIEDILTRPWRVLVGGSTHIYKGKTYKVHIGKRGGRYIIVKKIKKYIGTT